MASKLFIDTWGWVALRDKSEPQHRDVNAFFKRFRSDKGLVYTTDYVLVETFTILFARLPFVQARASLENIDELIAANAVRLIWIDRDLFARTKELRLRYSDKPRISFTDLSSMAVMQVLAIDTVLTGDVHFAQVGMGFRVAP